MIDIDKIKTYGIGTKVYCDTFAGLLSEILVYIKNGTTYPVCNKHSFDHSSECKLIIKLTCKGNKTYPYGSIMEGNSIHCFPRECYHKTGIFSYYVTPFCWK